MSPGETAPQLLDEDPAFEHFKTMTEKEALAYVIAHAVELENGQRYLAHQRLERQGLVAPKVEGTPQVPRPFPPTREIKAALVLSEHIAKNVKTRLELDQLATDLAKKFAKR